MLFNFLMILKLYLVYIYFRVIIKILVFELYIFIDVLVEREFWFFRMLDS